MDCAGRTGDCTSNVRSWQEPRLGSPGKPDPGGFPAHECEPVLDGPEISRNPASIGKIEIQNESKRTGQRLAVQLAERTSQFADPRTHEVPDDDTFAISEYPPTVVYSYRPVITS